MSSESKLGASKSDDGEVTAAVGTRQNDVALWFAQLDQDRLVAAAPAPAPGRCSYISVLRTNYDDRHPPIIVYI